VRKYLILLALLSITGYPQIIHEWPGEDRSELEIPEEVWLRAAEAVGFPNLPVGYTEEEMSNFPQDPYILPVVNRLFRDVLKLPGLSGRVSDALLKDPGNYSGSVELGYRLLDVRSGRGYSPPSAENWGVDWIADSANVDEVFSAFLSYCNREGIKRPISKADQVEWTKLPREIKKLVLRLVIADIIARPYLKQAYDNNFLERALRGNLTHASLYKLASAPWQDYHEVTPRASFEALDRIDLSYLGFASVIYLETVESAVNEYLESTEGKELNIEGFTGSVIQAPWGKVLVTGEISSPISGEYSLIVDLAGDDSYTGFTAAPREVGGISTVLDLGGNDTYETFDSAALACGLFGIGVILDLSGNDTYSCQESGLGCAWFGTGLLVDYSGNDQYTTHYAWGQGAAHAGVGILADISGDDNYDCATQSQGFGSTLGVGILVDSSGNDSFLAYPDGNPSAPFHNNSVSFAQGTGFGRRADYGDGHSLAGGIGVLADGAGNDTYSGGVYCQGAGYWWALGLLEDRAGNDTYSNVWYSLGSAPHFAAGCCVDLSGNDQYNTRDGICNDSLVSQTQGCARDGSVAWFIDGDGDDIYYHRNRCAGSGDLNSIAVFWDRRGDDSYTCDRNSSYPKDLSWGAGTTYEKFGSFRDNMRTVGMFLDTQGEDVYTEIVSEHEDENQQSLPLEAKDNSTWFHENSDPNSFGFGTDVEWYR